MQAGSLGGNATPTVVGNSIIVAGPGQYYAFDRATGAVNHFLQTTLSGGGGATVPFDAQHDQFYVPDAGALTAYHYGDNDRITQLWSISHGIDVQPFVALAADGRVYTESSSGILEVDPATGQVLKTAPEANANFHQLLITGHFLWVGGDQVTAYDLDTLSAVATLQLPQGGGPFDLTPVAADDSHLVVEYHASSGQGFAVFSVPEPIAAWGVLGGIALCVRRRSPAFG
jgi:hypothetical protein